MGEWACGRVGEWVNGRVGEWGVWACRKASQPMTNINNFEQTKQRKQMSHCMIIQFFVSNNDVIS